MTTLLSRHQRGFTMIELALVLVIAGLILVVVLRSTNAIQKAQVERMVSDLRGLQGILLEFQKRNGRLAGDCDNNGIVARHSHVPVRQTLLPTFNVTLGTPGVLDFAPANRQLRTPPDGSPGHPWTVCTDADPTRENNINLVWNELRRAGVVDSHRLPRELARHSMGDVFLVSTMFDTAALGGQHAGVIVVYGIPVWMAEAIDASIDGAATMYGPATANAVGAANTGRVRGWSGPREHWVDESTGVFRAHLAGTAAYNQGTIDHDRLIAISFQYTPNKLIR